MLTRLDSRSSYDNKRVYRAIDTAYDKINQLRVWTDKLFYGVTRRIQRSPWDKTNHEGILSESVYNSVAQEMIPDMCTTTIDHIKLVIAHLTNASRPTVVSLRQLIEEIDVISKRWDDIKYKDGRLSILVKSIILDDDEENVNLGNFRISIDIIEPINSLRIIAVTGEESYNGFFHPHVADEELCEGNGQYSLSLAIDQGRLEDYFDLVEKILRTYNPESPHTPLSSWYSPDREGSFYCVCCEEWKDEYDQVSCDGCDSIQCANCADGAMCDTCEQWYCDNCIQSCNCCHAPMCNECTLICEDCSDQICSECLSTCNSCGSDRCINCDTQCECCGYSICSDCKEMCKYCGEAVCKDCLCETCSDCGERVCVDCACECNHCGTYSCPPCDKKHKCLLETVEKTKEL